MSLHRALLNPTHSAPWTIIMPIASTAQGVLASSGWPTSRRPKRAPRPGEAPRTISHLMIELAVQSVLLMIYRLILGEFDNVGHVSADNS